MLKRIAYMLIPLAAGILTAGAQSQELPYTEGPVADVTPIRVQDGRFFDYWNWLETHWKPTMEEAKKQGLVLTYSVYEATPRTPEEPNLYLIVTYPNYAALDGLDAKMNAIDKQLFSLTPQKADQQSGQRNVMRTVLGDEILRELKFKK
jgi:hypothetical protein